MTLEHDPPAERWGALYGQSASLVKYLVELSDERQFLDFVDVALKRGCEQGLRQVYRLGVADLERRWRAHLLGVDSAVASEAAVPVSLRHP